MEWITKHGMRIQRTVLVLVVLALAVSLFLLGGRAGVEREYRNVEIALNYDDVRKMSQQAGVPVETLLAEYRAAGATSLLVKEDNFASLRPRLLVATGLELSARGLDADVSLGYLGTPDGTLAETLIANLEIRGRYREHFRDGGVTYVGTTLPLHGLWNLTVEERFAFNEVGMGWPQEEMVAAEALGYLLQLQIKDWAPLQGGAARAYFSQFEHLEAVSLVLFNSSNIHGFLGAQRDERMLVGEVAEEVRARGVPLAQIEFFDQRGFNYLAEMLDHDVVRLHSIAENELRLLSYPQALQRYRLAVKDRNMRSLLVRFRMDNHPDDYENSLGFVSELAAGLQADGYRLGPVQSLPPLRTPPAAILLIGLGVAAAGFWVAVQLGMARAGAVLGLAGLALVLALLLLGRPLLAQKILALAAAGLFPLAGVLWFLPRGRGSLRQNVAGFFSVSLVSLAGGILVAGLLRDSRFMLGLDGFAGVKLAHVLPLAGVGAAFFLRQEPARRDRLVRRILESPLTVKILLAGVLLLLVLGVYLMRTGNEAQAVSQLELAVRGLLERLTGARPRTKEFLIGHPFLLLAFCLGWELRTLPVWLLGMVGQVSLVNTYAHVHTPLWISLQRSGWGLLLGVAAGLLLVVAWRRVLCWWETRR